MFAVTFFALAADADRVRTARLELATQPNTVWAVPFKAWRRSIFLAFMVRFPVAELQTKRPRPIRSTRLCQCKSIKHASAAEQALRSSQTESHASWGYTIAGYR